MKRIKQTNKTPYGIFSPLEISEEEIDAIVISLDAKIKEFNED